MLLTRSIGDKSPKSYPCYSNSINNTIPEPIDSLKEILTSLVPNKLTQVKMG